MEVHVAGCREYVTSLAFGDDVITRFSPTAMVALHEELRGIDLKGDAAKVQSPLSCVGGLSPDSRLSVMF